MSYTSRVYRHRNAHTHENDSDNEQSAFFTKADKQSAAGKGESSFFQAKLTVNKPGDQYEQEADSVANAVVNKSGGMPSLQQKEISSVQRLATSAVDEEASTDEERMKKDKMVQRKCAECEKEEKEKGAVQKKDDTDKKKEEEEDQVKSATVQRKADSNSGTSGQLSSRIEQSAGNGNSLPSKTQAEMQQALGYNLDAVNIHADAEAADLNRQVKAQAFTHGKDIYFNAGKYNPESSEGKHLLAHELTHVIQQNAGEDNDIQRMAPCPAHLNATDPVPSGFKNYYGSSGVFHCGYRGILEDRIPTPSDPQNECFYDETGTLVDESHPYAGCGGTPNSYDSSTSWWDHTFNDPGGIWNAGWDAFWASRGHDARDSDWGTERHRYPDGTYHDEEGNFHMGPGPKY
jgi:hypothetical protein